MGSQVEKAKCVLWFHDFYDYCAKNVVRKGTTNQQISVYKRKRQVPEGQVKAVKSGIRSQPKHSSPTGFPTTGHTKLNGTQNSVETCEIKSFR
jgi:hypothetical protein